MLTDSLNLRIIFTWNASAFTEGVDSLRSRLYVVRTLVPTGHESFLRDEARFVSAHTSTAIEGNALNEEEAFHALLEGADADNPAQLEKTNLNEAYELALNLAEDPSFHVDEGLIRTMNSMILKGLPGSGAASRGRYRIGPSLVVDAATREIRYRPPRPDLVPALMEGFVDSIRAWTEDRVPGPVVAALVHFGLISMHPFDDGNGRTARLLADMVLHQTGFSAEGMLSVSKVIFDHRADYYAALRTTQGPDFLERIDATPFLDFHMTMMQAAAIALEERAVTLRRTFGEWQKDVKGDLNYRQTLVLPYLYSFGVSLSSSQYAALAKTSQSSAIADLNQLVREDILEKHGIGKATRYRLHPSIR